MAKEVTMITEKANAFSTEVIPEEDNVKVNNKKEEKKMTKDRIVSKVPVKAEPTNEAEFLAMLEAEFEAENPGLTLNPSAPTPGPFAQFDRLGQWDVRIKNIEIVTTKRAANEDTGEPAKMYKQLKIETDTTFPPCYININYILYENGEQSKTKIFDAKCDPSGTRGWYFTLKEASLEKKAEDIDLLKDCVCHKIKDNERIWEPVRMTEYAELRDILGVSELTFTGNKIEFPKDKTVSLYVYELMPASDAEPKKTMKKLEDGTKVEELIPPAPFYSVSFVPPCKQLNKDKSLKYDDRFTTSKDIGRRKTIANLPGVVHYLENL